jgi:hypothetical protein
MHLPELTLSASSFRRERSLKGSWMCMPTGEMSEYVTKTISHYKLDFFQNRM